FVFAKGAIEAGHRPTIFLAGEATYLLQESIVNAVHGVGWPPMAELWQSIVQEQIQEDVAGSAGRGMGTSATARARKAGQGGGRAADGGARQVSRAGAVPVHV